MIKLIKYTSTKVDIRHTMSYHDEMDIVYNWDSEKNQKLISSRCVSFEEVIAILEDGGELDIIEHPNQEKYTHQKMYVVEINNYVYLVPFVVNKNEIFLKTIIPNRRAKKIYLDK